MASPLDMNKFTAKERNAARKELLKKIDGYNRQMRRTKEPAFPLSSPTTDLVYRGVIKFTYDRGYALQTKSTLVDSNMTTRDVIDQLIDSLGLTGDVEDYQLQEINHMTQESRTVSDAEFPLSIQLQYGPHSNILELRLVQVRRQYHRQGKRGGLNARGSLAQDKTTDSDDDDDLGESTDVSPKDEVIDHGFANIEATMNEALEDMPTLIHDIQERLKLLSSATSNIKTPIPPRRDLWDMLKPQVSALIKDIRHLVDNGEFLATRHCPSNECRLIMTLLLELITDYSRELIVVTKEMCGLKGAAKTEFGASLNSFSQHISHISQLVNKVCQLLHAVALSGHLLHATAPENFIKGPLQNESCFTGSKGVSGILIFTTITAYLGLIRGAYEDKSDYYASLASNMLQSGNKVLTIIQKTDEYKLLHSHPLQSRVTDMERNLKIAMDTLVKKVKAATSRRPAPVSVPEMLLAGHSLITASLDFLMVAQCASLLHKVMVEGWEVLELPWVKGWVSSTSTKNAVSHERSDSESAIPQSTSATSYMSTDQVSSSSDTATERSYGTASTASSGRRKSRKSRILKGNGDGIYTSEAAEGKEGSVKITLQAGSLPLHYGFESGEDADDEGGGSLTHSRKTSFNDPRSETEDDLTRSRSQSLTRSEHGAQSPFKSVPSHTSTNDSTQYMGNAIKRLKQHHVLNLVVARIAERLLLSLTQKISSLSAMTNQDKPSKEHYYTIVEEIVSIAREIRDEASSMECDVVNHKHMEEVVDQSRLNLQTSVRDIYLALASATAENATERDNSRLLASLSNLQKVSSKTVGDALKTTKEHKKALEQAEKLEQEFVALVTGKDTPNATRSEASRSPSKANQHKMSSMSIKLQSDNDAESVILDSKARSLSNVWSAKITPKVIGGTKTQLMHRLTYHKVLDPDFVETFLLVFHKFLPSTDLLQFLLEKFCLNMPKDMDADSDKETFETEVAIPIRLRVVHILRLWLRYHPMDFTEDESLGQMLETFLQLIEESMTACSRHLRLLLKGDNHRMHSINRLAPQSILPLQPEDGKKFDVLDCNSLELARQLCLLYSDAYSRINLKEFLTLEWEKSETSEAAQGEDEESKPVRIPGIRTVQLLSKQLSRYVTRRVLLETDEDSQLIILSYFIKTAESCLQLKNFEAVFAIYKGLTTDSVKGAVRGTWRLLNEQEVLGLKALRDIASTDSNYQQYRTEQKKADQVPCVPVLDVLLQDVSATDDSEPDYLNGKPEILNFHKWRSLARILMTLHQLKNYPYNLTSVQIVQNFLSMFESPLTEQQWIDFI